MRRRRHSLTTAAGACAGALALVLAHPAHAQFGVSLDRRYDQNFYLTAHNAYANRQQGYIIANQDVSLERQLDDGIRALDLRVVAMAQGSCGPLSLPSFIIYGDNGLQCYAPLGCEPGAFHDMGPLQAVTAHHPELVQYAFNIGSRFPSLKSELDRIVGWLRSHPDQVVTLFSSTYVEQGNRRYRYLVDQAFAQSGADQYAFYPEGDNVGMPAPAGREGWWNVQRDGWPTLRAMVAANRRLVIDPKPVETVCCDESINPATWANAGGGAIDDFGNSLFTIQQTPSPPTILFNGYGTLHRKLGDVLQRWNRLPNFLWLDFYQGPVGDPYRFAADLNARWAQPPGVFRAAPPSIAPAPNRNGWINAAAPVTVAGFGGTIAGQQPRALVWSVSRLVPGPNGYRTLLEQPCTAVAWVPRSFDREGITTISYAGIDALGRRSDQQFLDVRIDRTPPTIAHMTDRKPNAAGWFNGDVTFSFSYHDALSGIDPDPLKTAGSRVLLATEGVEQRLYPFATDKAGNTANPVLGPFKIDKTPPQVTITGAKESFAADERIELDAAAADSLSGVALLATGEGAGAPVVAWTPVRKNAWDFPLGVNTLAARAWDNAGNVGQASVTFRVVVTFDSLCTLTKRFVADATLADALCARLAAAQGLPSLSGVRAAFIEQNYVSPVVAARDQKLATTAGAEILIRLARSADLLR
jgi:hypothetical protein